MSHSFSCSKHWLGPRRASHLFSVLVVRLFTSLTKLPVSLTGLMKPLAIGEYVFVSAQGHVES